MVCWNSGTNENPDGSGLLDGHPGYVPQRQVTSAILKMAVAGGNGRFAR